MKKMIPLILGVVVLSGCSHSPLRSDRLSTISIGDTKEHVIGVVGFPDNIVNQGKTHQIFIYNEGHWITKGKEVHSVYLTNNKVSLIKDEDITVK